MNVLCKQVLKFGNGHFYFQQGFDYDVAYI